MSNDQRHLGKLSLSTVAPATRMIVVEVIIDETLMPDGRLNPSATTVVYHPVLFIQSYLRIGSDPEDGTQDFHEAMMYADKSFVSIEYYFKDCLNSVHELVLCPWPEADDEQRLTGIVSQLRMQLVRKVIDSLPPESDCSTA